MVAAAAAGVVVVVVVVVVDAALFSRFLRVGAKSRLDLLPILCIK